LKRTRKIALAQGITAGVLFGTVSIFVRFLRSMDALSIVFWRLVIAASASAILVAFVARKNIYTYLSKKYVGETLFLGVFLGAHFILAVSSVLDTTILNATVLVNTTPIFSMLISSLLFKVKPSKLALLGVSLSFLGAGIIAYADASSGSFGFHLKGDVEAILASLVEAVYLTFGSKIRRERTSILTTMLSIYLASTLVVLFPIAVTRVSICPPLELVVPLLGLGILSTSLAHSLYFSSLSDLKSFETATLALLEPICASLLAASIFGEIPSLMLVLGGALVLSGIISVTVSE